MLQAMLAGVASVKAQQTRMNVIGNNLANVNTTAFKGSRVTFQDMIAQTIRGASRPNGSSGGTNPIQFGLGVLVAGTDVNNEQGSLAATNRPSDLAIQGNGFFVVSNSARTAYSRDGAFDLDANGILVQRATGERLVGWTADEFGNIDATKPLGPTSYISVPIGSLDTVQVSTRASFKGNLNSSQPSGVPVTTPTMRVYDGLGGAHDIDLVLQNPTPVVAGPGVPVGATTSWEWSMTEGATTIGSYSSGTNTRLYFDANGNLLNPNTFGSITVPASGGASAFPVEIDFSKIRQLATESNVTPYDQNGFPPGSLQGYSIGSDGVVTGLFTNGLTRAMGQVAVAIVSNPGGMERVGNNLWRQSDNSGIPVLGTPKSGGRGGINSGFLEQSNVDISNEFTDMIITQRGFQANTKVISTVDEMLQELINVKR